MLCDGDLCACIERVSSVENRQGPFWPLGDLNMVFAMNHRLSRTLYNEPPPTSSKDPRLRTLMARAQPSFTHNSTCQRRPPNSRARSHLRTLLPSVLARTLFCAHTFAAVRSPLHLGRVTAGRVTVSVVAAPAAGFSLFSRRNQQESPATPTSRTGSRRTGGRCAAGS